MGMNKFKLKAVVAAIALGAAAQANAALIDGNTGDGELFLSAWDPVKQVAYTLDTGMTISQFKAVGNTAGANISFNFAADANWTTFRTNSTSANTVWNIGALDSTATGGVNYLATSTNPKTSFANQTSSGVAGMANTNNYISALNALPGMQATANGSVYTVAADGLAYADNTYWGATYGSKASGWTTTTGIDSSMGFFNLSPNTGSLSKATTTQFGYADASNTLQAGQWLLSSSGSLTYTTPSAVPVPAALWLLGSAMVGLVGVARRKVA